MPAPKRPRREPTHDWEKIKQWTLWPEQQLCEQLRPIVLFGETAGERAKETNAAQRTLARKADDFEHQGMLSLFSEAQPREGAETAPSLPPAMHQLIEDVHAELPTMSWREMAEMCYMRYSRIRWPIRLAMANGHTACVQEPTYGTKRQIMLWQRTAKGCFDRPTANT